MECAEDREPVPLASKAEVARAVVDAIARLRQNQIPPQEEQS